jgi:hypothetical protein
MPDYAGLRLNKLVTSGSARWENDLASPGLSIVAPVVSDYVSAVLAVATPGTSTDDAAGGLAPLLEARRTELAASLMAERLVTPRLS